MNRSIIYLLLPFFFLSCAELSQIASSTGTSTTDVKPTNSEVINGLKEALVKGAEYASTNASKEDGYFKNPQLKIPFPPEAAKVESKLRDIGLGGEVDKFILSLNRAAEEAAGNAVPVFKEAIMSMTVEDGWAILNGPDDAATQYLKETTTTQLTTEFKPVVENALDDVNATKYYDDLVNTYNKIPFVEKVNPDLSEYATEMAIDGLFVLVADEEKKIREDPVERTTELLKKVFGYTE